MNCDICKINESSIFLQRNMGIRKRKYYICQSCAEKLGIKSDPENLSQAFSIIDNIISQKNENFKLSTLPNLTKICPVCGSSFEAVFTQGKIGCAECYHTFEDEFIKRFNIESEYSGNLPKRLKGYRSTLTDRVDIRMKLERAVANEEYEKAALYRDYLKVLEKGQNLNGELNPDINSDRINDEGAQN